MADLLTTLGRDEYNTSIKDISGLKDYSLIFKIIESYFKASDTIIEKYKNGNEIELRTEKTRTKVMWAINKSILQFKTQEHRDLIRSIFVDEIPFQDKKFAFFWQFALNNRLFREITGKVFIKAFYSGRACISKDDIIAYLKEFLRMNESLELNWAEDTIYRLATKYLSLMSKFDFVSSDRIKSFSNVRPSSEAQVLFLYLAKLMAPTSGNILANELLPLNFIQLEDLHERLKKLSAKGLFDMNYNGVALNIELTHSYKRICNVLYNRS